MVTLVKRVMPGVLLGINVLLTGCAAYLHVFYHRVGGICGVPTNCWRSPFKNNAL